MIWSPFDNKEVDFEHIPFFSCLHSLLLLSAKDIIYMMLS